MNSKSFTDYLQSLMDSGAWAPLIRGPGAPKGTIHTAEHNTKIGESVKRWRHSETKDIRGPEKQ